MAERESAAELERLLENYQDRIAQVRLELPGAEELGPGATQTPPEPGGSSVGLATAPSLEVPPHAAQPAEAAPWSGLHRAVLALTALAAAAILAQSLWRRHAERAPGMRRSFPIPYTDTAGLAIEGNTLFSVDRKRQLLFSFSADGMQIKSVEQFPNPGVSGFALGERCLWSTDADTGYIYQHDLDWKHSIRKAYANPSRNPTAVYWDGQHLWVHHSKTETVVQFLVRDSLVPVEQYTLPGMTPVGFHINNGILWAFDANTRKLSRFRLGVLALQLDTADLSPWIPPRSAVTGFALGASELWLLTQNPSELLRFELKGLRWVAHEFNPAENGSRF